MNAGVYVGGARIAAEFGLNGAVNFNEFEKPKKNRKLRWIPILKNLFVVGWKPKN